MGTPAQIAALEKARAARKAKSETGGARGINVPTSLDVVASSTGKISFEKVDMGALAQKVEVLWLERENGIAAQRLNNPYNIAYRCRECGAVVEEVAPQFLLPLGKQVRCPKCFPMRGLTEMDH